MMLQVIGDPVLHSLSPLIQGAMLGELGLNIPYTPHLVRRGELPAYLDWARAHGVTGFNATMPHKEDLIPLLDQVDGNAAQCSAVNTVCLKNGRWTGFNTDGDGCLEALRASGMDPAGQRVLVLGAGGAARAVVPALVRSGAEAVFVCNRSARRASALCALDHRGLCVPYALTPDILARLAPACSLVVNCTSLGMAGTEGQFDSFDFLDALPAGSGVFDLIYHPAETELVRRARLRGLRAANGLGMLVWQAALALEKFLDRPLDRPRLTAAATAALRAAGHL